MNAGRVSDADRDTFIEMVLQNPVNRTLLDRLPHLELPDAWLVAGCLCQTVWNLNSGYPPAFGIRDYDIFYFNGDDLSWEAEDRDIRRVASMVSDIAEQVEVKNQARVHIWYGERFGPGYPQLASSRDGVDRFLIGCTRVALRVDQHNAGELYAPDGLTDLFEGILRPNPVNDRPALFLAKSESYRARWPWLRIDDARPVRSSGR